MDSGVEVIQIIGAELADSLCVGRIQHRACIGCLSQEVIRNVAVSYEVVAQPGKLGVVRDVVEPEPPLPDDRRNEWGDKTTDIDEYIENLESGIALSLSPFELLGTFLGCLGLEVVVELAHDSLEVALEQTVTESDQEKGDACEGKQPDLVGRCGKDGNR